MITEECFVLQTRADKDSPWRSYIKMNQEQINKFDLKKFEESQSVGYDNVRVIFRRTTVIEWTAMYLNPPGFVLDLNLTPDPLGRGQLS